MPQWFLLVILLPEAFISRKIFYLLYLAADFTTVRPDLNSFIFRRRGSILRNGFLLKFGDGEWYNCKSRKRRSATMAAGNGRTDIVKLLKEYGAKD
jgi:hypothetical protein